MPHSSQHNLISQTPMRGFHFAGDAEWSNLLNPPTPEAEVDATAAMQAELKLVANSVRQVHDQLLEQHERQQELLTDIRSAVVELAMAVATQVLQETPIDEQRVRALVADTVALLPKEQPASVFLHPSDADLLDEMDIQRHIERKLMQVGADSSIPRGSCRVEGPHYGYVSHWKMHLANIRRNLLDQLDD